MKREYEVFVSVLGSTRTIKFQEESETVRLGKALACVYNLWVSIPDGEPSKAMTTVAHVIFGDKGRESVPETQDWEDLLAETEMMNWEDKRDAVHRLLDKRGGEVTAYSGYTAKIVLRYIK